MKPSLSFFLMAYQDGRSLSELIPHWHRVLKAHASPFEIIIVDDASTDGTGQIVNELRATCPELVYVRHEVNRGVGAVFQSGVAASKYDWVAYSDGDYQYDPDDLPRFIALLERCDVVIGFRENRADPAHRKGISVCYNLLTDWLYDTPWKDVNCSLKVFRREILMPMMPLLSSGPFFDAEALIKARHQACKIVEIPVTHWPRRYGRSTAGSWRNLRRSLKEMTSVNMEGYLRDKWMIRLVSRLIRRWTT